VILPTKVGVYAGWTLDFRTGSPSGSEVASFGSADYYASIEASMPGDLSPGAYTFVVEGMTSEDFGDLHAARASLFVNLHLYWNDRGIAGTFIDLAGLSDTLNGSKTAQETRVACLRVTALRRRAGSRRYEVVIEGREYVFDRLLRPFTDKGEAPTIAAALDEIQQQVGDFFLLPMMDGVPLDEGDVGKMARSWSAGEKPVEQLRVLGRALEQLMPDHQSLGMFLIREDVLIAGPGRLDLEVAETVDADSGLVEILETGQEAEDPGFVAENAEDKPAAPRDLFDLVLRGRPDLRPGQVVAFSRPPDTDQQGRALDFNIDVTEVSKTQEIAIYVRGVTHRLARELGFVTTLRGVSVPGFSKTTRDPNLAWFKRRGPAVAEPNGGTAGDGSAASRVVRHIDERTLSRSGRRADIGQVRGANVAAGDRPSQTERVRRGAFAGDGRRFGAARFEVDAKRHTIFDEAPYATPFAFGKFGLVLPRYPGTRVLLVHRDGDNEDPVDVGALWTRGTAPASLPGDWWLSLPAEVPPEERGQIADDAPIEPPAGKASNDLIDADGNRVIEVGRLRIRVGRDLLGDAGTRPEAAPTTVSIEHEKGSKITIDEDGNITVVSAKKLDLVAEERITIDSKADIVLTVGGVVDVRKRT
jgi:hypothetical protein